MVASLKRKGNTIYCGNCMMTQHKLRPVCGFCGCEFSNYSSVMYTLMKVQEDEKVISDYYDDFDYSDVYRVR